MKAFVYPSKPFGTIIVPPSKSMAHRALICAALASGKSEISNIYLSEDIKATIDGLKSLGALIEVNGDKITVKGIDFSKKIESGSFNANESGSTLRFIIPICSLISKHHVLYGTSKLISRPLDVYKDIFKSDLIIEKESVVVNGMLKAGDYTVKGDISSQFISGLLFTLPLLNANSTIKILPPFESKSYIDLTISMQKLFNVNIEFKDNTCHIKGNQKYLPYNEVVEGDYSQAAFYMVLNSINPLIDVKGLKANSLQGDRMIEKVVNDDPDVYDLADCPDLGPILCVLASTKRRTTKIINIARLRIKESDRVDSMEKELKKLGVDFKSTKNEIIINGKSEFDTDLIISSHNDHRICMAMAILATITKKGLMIDGIECVKKSYPNFFDDLKSLNVRVDLFE